MKIKKLSTKQFAGIRGKEVSFSDGINVVYGENESGKSTLVNLMLSLFFQDTKLIRTKKADKAFIEAAFPAKRKDGAAAGDLVYGKVEFETPEGEYTLEKKWGTKKSGSELDTPGGIYEDEDTISSELSDILGYGAGVYREMLLSPQSSAAENLRSIFERNDTETRRTLAEAVTEAVAENGISLDELEKRINERIDALAGKHWDFVNKCPEKKTGRWKKEMGAVLQALYDAEDAEKLLCELKELNQKYDEALKYCSEAGEAARDAAQKLSEFDRLYDLIRTLKDNEAKIARIEEDLKRFSAALKKYPQDKTNHEQAVKLNDEMYKRDLLDRYSRAKKCYDELNKVVSKLSDISRPADDEISLVKASEIKISKQKNLLCGMNIKAKIKMLGGNTVKITSLITGEEIALNGETADIREAVLVNIPGVADIELAPANVDPDKINAEISELENTISQILAKYKCEDCAALEKLAKNYDKLLSEKQIAENNLKNAVGGATFEELQREAEGIPDAEKIRGMEDILADVKTLCGNNLPAYIGAKESEIKSFENTYESVDALQVKISEHNTELEKARKAVKNTENIPEEYKNVTDPEKYKAALKSKSDDANAQKEKALIAKSTAETERDKFIEDHGDDLDERSEKAQREYNEQVELLYKWVHIRDEFYAHKTAMKSNPLENLAQNFERYLQIISNNRITPEFTEIGKPDFDIVSNNFSVDYDKLSDGTRETVYLAFRLAVLEHLFPQGGGIIVLDDPMNDMDENRVKQSCALIKECAKRHQVILLTCRKEYAQQLNVKEIII